MTQQDVFTFYEGKKVLGRAHIDSLGFVVLGSNSISRIVGLI